MRRFKAPGVEHSLVILSLRKRPLTSVSHCVVDGGYPAGTNILIGDPLLLPLGFYGGPTPTIPLGAGSPAADAGLAGAGIPALDQRNFTRDGMPDIGSCEASQSLGVLLIDIDATSLGETAGLGATTVFVTRTGDTSLPLVVNLLSGDANTVSVPATPFILLA